MKNFHLSGFDINFLNYLHTNKVAATKQLHRDLFKTTYSICCKKIQRLEQNELIQRHFGAKRYEKSFLYTLAENGMKVVTDNNPSIIAHMRYRSSSINHDIILVDIRSIMLKKKMVKSYYTENQIQTYRDFDTEDELVIFKKTNCDASVTLQSSNGEIANIALEVELSGKSMVDYQKKVSDLCRSPQIDAVLYICRNKTIEERIKKVEQILYPNQYKKIYFLQLDEFLKSNQSVTFCNQDGKRLAIN